MKNTSKMIALLLVVAMMVTVLAGCGKKIDVDQYQAPAATQAPAAPAAEAPATEAPAEAAAPAELSYADGTVLRMATGYNSTKTGLSMDAEVAGEGVTLADGVTYHAGDLKPTWVEVEKQLGIKIEDKYQGNSA
nr:hypothetical protein [Clostridia bacterium]